MRSERTSLAWLLAVVAASMIGHAGLVVWAGQSAREEIIPEPPPPEAKPETPKTKPPEPPKPSREELLAKWRARLEAEPIRRDIVFMRIDAPELSWAGEMPKAAWNYRSFGHQSMAKESVNINILKRHSERAAEGVFEPPTRPQVEVTHQPYRVPNFADVSGRLFGTRIEGDLAPLAEVEPRSLSWNGTISMMRWAYTPKAALTDAERKGVEAGLHRRGAEALRLALAKCEMPPRWDERLAARLESSFEAAPPPAPQGYKLAADETLLVFIDTAEFREQQAEWADGLADAADKLKLHAGAAIILHADGVSAWKPGAPPAKGKKAFDSRDFADIMAKLRQLLEKEVTCEAAETARVAVAWPRESDVRYESVRKAAGRSDFAPLFVFGKRPSLRPAPVAVEFPRFRFLTADAPEIRKKLGTILEPYLSRPAPRKGGDE